MAGAKGRFWAQAQCDTDKILVMHLFQPDRKVLGFVSWLVVFIGIHIPETVEELLRKLEEKPAETPYIDKLIAMKGIGLITANGFIAEVGDIGRFDNPKQLQKLAGYAIVANDSGKHNGEIRISYRGRKRLRYTVDCRNKDNYNRCRRLNQIPEKMQKIHTPYTRKC